jgi:DNA-binding IclR family transcriptional regulator
MPAWSEPSTVTESGLAAVLTSKAVVQIVGSLAQVDDDRARSLREIAELSGVSTRTVRNHVEHLESVGLLAETDRGYRFGDTELAEAFVEIETACWERVSAEQLEDSARQFWQ